MALEIRHAAKEKRFEAPTDSGVARLDYEQLDENTLEFKHTFVPEDDRGEGVAGEIVKQAFEYASDHDLLVRPTCPFVRSWLEENPGFRELTVEGAGIGVRKEEKA